jgi:hypothetical protein
MSRNRKTPSSPRSYSGFRGAGHMRLVRVTVPECMPVCLGTGVDNSAKVFSEVSSRGEAALNSHDLNRQVTGFEKSLGQVDALRL